MHIRLWVAGTIASMILMAIAGCGSSGGSEDRIVFLAAPDGRPDLYVMNPDGSETLRITNSSEMERRAVWSPDGRKIAFTAEYSGGLQRHIRRERRRLRADKADRYCP